ncbi:MAG: AarF/UbiB family protein [Vicinamibacterales bacterium]
MSATLDRDTGLVDAPPSRLRRYRQIASVLVRHGLADVVDALHLGSYLALGTRLLPRRARVDPSLSRAARFRLTLEELGPTFIKFGQALSVRADVLPPAFTAELATLQEHVSPLEPGVAEAVIAREFGQPVEALFTTFDPVPLAAASMAQVHRATLPTGEIVAVKVRRPGIRRVIAGDVEILRQLAALVERSFAAAAVVRPVQLVEEFARTIRAELDLAREGRHIEHVARNFAGDPTVRVPWVHWPLTTPRVLTMEFLDGARVADLAATGVPVEVRRLVAARGADAVLAQVLVHGFFHADPHPGNLLVLDGPDGPVIGFLDFGIVGRLDERHRRQIARVIRAVWRRDAPALTTVALAITRPEHDVDVPALEQDLGGLLDAYADVPLGELSMTEVLTEVIGTAARHQLRIPSTLMLLIKTVMTIEGVGRQLDPTFRIVRHAAPLADRLWRQEFSPVALAARAGEATRAAMSAMRAAPANLDAIARKVRDGRLEVRFVHRNLDHFVREMDRSSNRLSFAIVIGAIVVGSSVVIQAGVGPFVFGYPVLGVGGFLVAGFLGIGLAIGVLRSGRL